MLRLALAFSGVVLTAFWLFFGNIGLGVSGEWVLRPNARAWPPGAWGLPLAVVMIFGGAAALAVYDRFRRAKTRKEQTNSTVTALVCLSLTLFLWPWALLGPGQVQREAGRLTLEGRFNIIAALWSDVATEYFGTAYQIEDAHRFLRSYPRYQQPRERALAHVATHPPGAVLFFYAVRRTTERVPGLEQGLTRLAERLTGESAAELTTTNNLLRATVNRSVNAPEPPPLPQSAIASGLFAAFLLGFSLVLALPAVYGLAATGGGENAEKRGLVAAGLWALAPTTNLFAFTLDALVASGVVWTLFLVARGLAKPKDSVRALAFFFAAGLALGLTTFLSFGALSVVAIGAGALLWMRRRHALRPLLAFFAAFALVWTVAAWWGTNPLAIFQNAMAAHRFATLEVRSHGAWIVMNLVTFAFFCGWPVVAMGRLKWPRHPTSPALAVGALTLGVILLLTLSGNVRGEVERLWLFLLAPVCVGALEILPWRWLAPLIVLQVGQTSVMAATLAPLVRPF